jgi:hypothetical protein
MNAEMQREPVRRKAVWGSRIRMAVALAGALLLTSCSEAIRTGQSPSYLIIQTMGGGIGSSSVVQSDVVSDTGSVVQDGGSATLQAALKDPLGPAPSTTNTISITQYHVEYLRSDGHNVQGVDVPFAFDAGVTASIPAGGVGSVSFTLVRIQAKIEAPLKALAGHRGQEAISTTVKVTFYGHDQNGREVSVTGNIEVDFADWAG